MVSRRRQLLLVLLLLSLPLYPQYIPHLLAGPAAQICDNRPESGAISSTEAAGSSVSQRKAGSVWKNLDKKLKEKKQLKD